MSAAAHVAALRFGLGPRPGDRRAGDRPAEDERAALLAQLEAPPDQAMPPQDWEQDPTVADALAVSASTLGRQPGAPQPSAVLFLAEARAYLARLVATPTPFRERLTAFWANHFTVSGRASGVAPLVGDYIRTAIRPHVAGPFATLLKAAVRHPAMLFYLDQSASVGPDSPFGRSRGRGLNENLGREVLELHTLSPAAGYGQADVTAFAHLLTGLVVERNRDPRGTVFRAALHQPGEKTVMGRRFPPGEASIDAALDWLAGHPATHRHLAFKLARHFIADDPPPEAVDRLYGVLRDTGGDLGAATRELLAIPEAWQPLTKLRGPIELTVAALRAMGAGPEAGELAYGIARDLGQPVWSPIAPNGWPDRAEAWIHPEGMMMRLDRMHAIGGRFARRDARDALDLVLGPLASAETRQAVLRAGSNAEALTLLLGSPEFQRR